MTADALTGTCTISEAESRAFATLSGDYNPLHTDQDHARRLPFGGTVVHGVHHLLRTLDRALEKVGNGVGAHPVSLDATFPSPVRADEQINYRLISRASQNVLDLTAFSQGRKVLTLTLACAPDSSERRGQSEICDDAPPREQPIEQGIPLGHRTGQVRLHYEAGLAGQLLPYLHARWPHDRLAQILACTRVVGMRCPGLHSIFSALSLKMSAEEVEVDRNALRYTVAREDGRLNMLRVKVSSRDFHGRLDTFVRPGPIQQPDYAVVRASVPGTSFSRHRAIVIGGSRGVGETSAKILAAGGARVVITYQAGKADAERVCQDIRSGSGECDVMQFDARGDVPESTNEFLHEFAPTQIFYFASPHITQNRTGHWDPDLFKRFCSIYLDSFAAIVEAIAGAATKARDSVTFFYPSSVFVETPEKGFAEYAAAKAAGEAYCVQARQLYPSFRFVSPRLPKMNTDQTSAIIPIKSASVLEIMKEQISNLAGI